MIEKIKALLTEPVRAYIYRVLIAVGAALVGFGLISGDDFALVLGVVVAALNIMPASNTTTKG
jgi:hypothetical protein